MNRSGGPVAAVAKFYGIEPGEILVVHDDIDLPPGVARLKLGGGHGGHNGVRDVIAHLGADFWRLRLGVGHPGSKDLVLDAVLDRPTQAEQQAIDEALSRALEIMPELLRSGAQKAMHSLHSRNSRRSRVRMDPRLTAIVAHFTRKVMPIQCGIVGLPNVGKSTLFNALTRSQIAAENYPFCTIDPNVGVVPVPDERLEQLAEIAHPQKILPTAVEFVDIAGLVKGASQGEGLGNQFLAHIREVDAIAHVVRCFEDDDVVHVAGRIDPLSDLEIINTELGLADLASVDKAVDRATKAAKSGDKKALLQRELFERVRGLLNEGTPRAGGEAGRRGAARPARTAPADREAGHLHRQRR
jgi:hypothetical protein